MNEYKFKCLSAVISVCLSQLVLVYVPCYNTNLLFQLSSEFTKFKEAGFDTSKQLLHRVRYFVVLWKNSRNTVSEDAQYNYKNE